MRDISAGGVILPLISFSARSTSPGLPAAQEPHKQLIFRGWHSIKDSLAEAGCAGVIAGPLAESNKNEKRDSDFTQTPPRRSLYVAYKAASFVLAVAVFCDSC